MKTFELKAKDGFSAVVTEAGASVLALRVPTAHGIKDVLLGDMSPQSRLQPGPMFGATLGRCAGRIKDGEFLLNREAIKLSRNSGENHCHGGVRGFDKRVFEAIDVQENAVTMRYLSSDGEEGYPGNLDLQVRFSVSEDQTLEIEYTAVSDQDTVVNISNHVYFNLGVHPEGSVDGHIVKIRADEISVPDTTGVPVRRMPVAGSRFDFRQPRPIGAGDYDHNYILNPTQKASAAQDVPAAQVFCPETGLQLRAYTDMPAMQFYVADFSGFGLRGKQGELYDGRCGFCLEAQYTPNAVNLSEEIQPILKKGAQYRHCVRFQIEDMGGEV